jgi:hypothetical protein
VYGPVRTVVWQGSAGDRRPYANLTGYSEVIETRNQQHAGHLTAKVTKLQICSHNCGPAQMFLNCYSVQSPVLKS